METIRDDTTKEKARKFIEIFRGLPDARGTVAGACIRGTLTLEHVLQHLEGKESLGRYPIFDGKYIKWAAVDFDFKQAADRVALSETHAKEYAKAMFDLGIKHCWFERSKSGLIHLWTFYREKVLAEKVRYILISVAKDLGLKIANGIVEIFPKQNDVSTGHFGNYISLPYCGALVC